MAVRSTVFACAVVLFTALRCVSLQAAPIKLSFLVDPQALRDTVAFLTNSGCNPAAVFTFQAAVSNHLQTGFGVDLSHLPSPKHGYYQFATARELITTRLTESVKHVRDFTCFDSVILLTEGGLKADLRPDDLSGPYLVPMFVGEFPSWTLGTVLTATPRDAFTVYNPPEYQLATDHFFDGPARESRICLTAALAGQLVLPFNATNNCGKATFDILHAAWKRYGLKFPVNPEIILVHGLKGFIITEDHCALLFRRGKGYTYIEKMGPTSPFVRLDVETRADVLAWLGAQHFGSDTFSRTFATFNDTVIEEISPPKP